MATRPSTTDDEAAVGQRLRSARQERQLSLREVARRLDISASALSQIETGKSRPSVRTLYALVSELGLSMDDLFAKPAGQAGGSAPESGEGKVPGEVRPGAGPAGERRGSAESESEGEGHGSPKADSGGASDVSAESVSSNEGDGPAESVVPSEGAGSVESESSRFVQRANSRATLRLDSGVTWERLTPSPDPNVDFLVTTYDVGGASSSGDAFVRHGGHEYGIVLSGQLEVSIGFEKYVLNPGDSCSFDSNEPHRLANPGDVPAKAVWIVVGRRHSDARNPTFEGD